MSSRWVVETDYPEGHLVPMTPDEQAQLDADQAAALAEASRPAPPTLEDKFQEIVDAVLNAPDFETAKKQIAALTGKTGKGT